MEITFFPSIRISVFPTAFSLSSSLSYLFDTTIRCSQSSVAFPFNVSVYTGVSHETGGVENFFRLFIEL